MRKFLIILSCIFYLAASASGQVPEKKQYTATRITTAPVIDGKTDEEVWQIGTWAGDFIQNEPYNGSKATQRTEFKILFDDNNLYVAIKAYDSSPDSIVNRLTRRDQADGDLVGIIIDSYHDLRTGFLFGVSSSGVKYDQMFTNDGLNQDSSWDPNWWVKTSINKEGWISEMKIPFSQLRFKKNPGEVWGMDVARVIYRKNETSFWQAIPRDAPGLVNLFGELSGLEQIKPRKIFDITPYGVAKAETFEKIPGNPFMAKGRSSKLNGGIDAKIGITNNMTMDLTVNPDFGQVEADPSEVNLTAYETYFTERRPFFIEGNNITTFDLGIDDESIGNDNLFYSRRIGRPPQVIPDLKDNWSADIPGTTTILGAAKLTGKSSNGLSVGFVEALTAEERAEIDTAGGRYYRTAEPLTNYLVSRVQKDFNNGRTIIGGIFTSTNRELDSCTSNVLHKAAYTGGFDFTQYFKDKSWRFSIKTALSLVEGTKSALLKTQTSSARYFQRPDNYYADVDSDRTSLSGSGGRAQIMKLNGHWNFLGSATWRSPGFETNDLGYLKVADQIVSVIWGGYNEWEPKGIYRNYNLNFHEYSVWNFGGYNLGNGIEFNANMGLKNFWNIWSAGTYTFSGDDQDILRGGPMMKVPGSVAGRFGFSTDSRKKVMLEFRVSALKGLEHNSNDLTTGVELSFKPTDFLVLSVEPGFNKSMTELQYVTTENVSGEDKYIFATINRKTISTSFRINLNISPDLTFQYWGQPFVASGKYTDHKFIQYPMANGYDDRFHIFSPQEISPGDNSYNIDEDNDGNIDYSFDNKDFNVQEFLSNLVIRWEYNPGSSVYLVWSQTRSNSNNSGNLDYFNDLGDLFNKGNNTPHNVFLIKFSYRFGLK